MKCRLYCITLAALCLGLTLSAAIAAQAPKRSKAIQLGVVWPGHEQADSRLTATSIALLDGEVIAEATDPPGDMSPPLGWRPWPDPTRHVSVGEDAFRFDLPLMMLHSPQSAFSWSVDSRAATDGTLHDQLDQQGIWQPGGTSTVADPEDQGVNDYADLRQATVQTLDPQHLRFEVQVRGNAAGAWDSEMYIFSLFPHSTQEWDTWLYVLPWDDPPQTWWSTIAYGPAVAPSPALPYLDLTSSRLSREGGELVIETTVGDTLPDDPHTAPVTPMFAWWFNRVTGGANAGGDERLNVARIVAFEVGFSWRVSAHKWVDGAWVHFADLQYDIAGNTMTVHVPAGVLPFNTRLLWSTSSGFFLGDDPETYHSDVDWMDGIEIGPLAAYRVYLPLIRRDS